MMEVIRQRCQQQWTDRASFQQLRQLAQMVGQRGRSQPPAFGQHRQQGHQAALEEVGEQFGQEMIPTDALSQLTGFKNSVQAQQGSDVGLITRACPPG